MIISKRQLNQINIWLKSKNEVYGTVKETKKGVIFDANFKKGRIMFHTHPQSEVEGGYSAPSIQDMITFVKHRKDTPINYVISMRGIYKVELKCELRKFTNLLKELRKLKNKYKPGTFHHKKWMKEINELSPCLIATFYKI